MPPLFIIKRNLPHYKLKTELSFMARPKRNRLKELNFISSGVGLPSGDTRYKWIQNSPQKESYPCPRTGKWRTWSLGSAGKPLSVASCGMFTFLHGKRRLPNTTVFLTEKPGCIFASCCLRRAWLSHTTSEVERAVQTYSMLLKSWTQLGNVCSVFVLTARVPHVSSRR